MNNQDHLSDRHFAEIARRVEGFTGIMLPPGKRVMVEGRLRKRVRALGLSDLEEYGRQIIDRGGLESEFLHVVDCVTTNKTDFFREPQHFDFLVEHAIPHLLEGRNRHAPLRFWSAAASIGAEAYTIGMVAAELLGLEGAPFEILGTDVSGEVLAQAARAVYPLAYAAPVQSPYRERYLMFARDAKRQEFRIVPELRRRATFQRLNLMDRSYAVKADVDVIFCRNVLIYFSKETQAGVIARLSSYLRIGGYLILGHSESLGGADKSGLRPLGPNIFRRER